MNVIQAMDVVNPAPDDNRNQGWHAALVSALAERIRWVLADRKMEQRDWGLAAGLAESFIGAFLQRAKHSPAATINVDAAAALARAARVSLVWLSTGEGSPEPDPVLVDAARPALSSLPGWTHAEAEARRRYGDRLDPRAYELARNASAASAPDPLTPEFVHDVAWVLWKHHTDPARAARQQKKLDAQISADKTRAGRRMRPPPEDVGTLNLKPPPKKPRRK